MVSSFSSATQIHMTTWLVVSPHVAWHGMGIELVDTEAEQNKVHINDSTETTTNASQVQRKGMDQNKVWMKNNLRISLRYCLSNSNKSVCISLPFLPGHQVWEENTRVNNNRT